MEVDLFHMSSGVIVYEQLAVAYREQTGPSR